MVEIIFIWKFLYFFFLLNLIPKNKVKKENERQQTPKKSKHTIKVTFTFQYNFYSITLYCIVKYINDVKKK
jgi:hypothetical protein